MIFMNNSFSYHDFHVNQYMEAVTFIQCSQNPQNTIESPMTINKDKMGDQSSNNENNLYVCWDKITYIDSFEVSGIDLLIRYFISIYLRRMKHCLPHSIWCGWLYANFNSPLFSLTRYSPTLRVLVIS